MTAGRTPIRISTLRPIRDGAIVACVVLGVAHLTGFVQTGVDAHSHWVSNLGGHEHINSTSNVTTDG